MEAGQESLKCTFLFRVYMVLWHSYLSKTASVRRCRIKATTFNVIKETEEQVEVSFSRPWDPSMQGKLIPLNIDKRYFLSPVHFHRSTITCNVR